MTEFVHIEPGRAQRPAFAAWGLAQDPPLQTASASGWDVPLDLYPAVPVELLEGAFIDGYLAGSQPTPAAPAEAVERPLTALAAILPPTSTRKPRKAAARRRTTAEPVSTAPTVLDFSNTDTLLIEDIAGGAE